MNWLSTLLDYLLKLWPFEKLQPWERGIKLTYQVKLPLLPEPEVLTQPIGPGTHFVLWYFQELRKESTVPQVMDLLSQSIMTKDNQAVSFSVNIEYEIEDPTKNILGVHNFESSLEAACRIHLARRVRELSWNELIEKQSWLEDRLTETLTTRAKRWGAKINEVGFTDLTRSKTLRLLGDTKWSI
jgi:regulator of protease activity HflC (stomatin/prohibitin superfamily)